MNLTIYNTQICDFRSGFVACFNQVQCNLKKNSIKPKFDCKQNAIGQNAERNDAKARLNNLKLREIIYMCAQLDREEHTQTLTQRHK